MSRRATPKFAVGDRVKLTGKFLRNTGQHTGPEGMSVWTVRAIDGDYITTDQRHTAEYVAMFWTTAELEAMPELWYRRIHAGNLYKVGTLTSENCP